MVPYRDNLVGKGWSYGSYLLVAVLSAINLPLFLQAKLYKSVIAHYGFIPFKFSTQPATQLHTLISSVFLHGDLFHLLGNCLFLVIFGRSLERLFGRVAYLAAFPLLGVAGLLAQWALYPDSRAPVIGASGAIAFLMGAYLVLFPKAKIRMIFFFGWLWKRFTLPAWAFLGYWGGLQLLSTVLGTDDGIAYAVHAGSFVAGAVGAMAWKTTFPSAEERLLEFTGKSFA